MSETASHIGRVTADLQAEIMKVRMLPIEQVFNRFPRMVRDLAQRHGKEIDLVVEGQETELDRSLIEEIVDPLTHLLRNCVDHGLELPDERRAAGKDRRGRIRLTARHEESQIVIDIADDGRGIDPARVREAAVRRGVLTPEAVAQLSDQEALNLIFLSGISTARQVSDLSGRGVGMDVVRSNMQKIGGEIDIDTQIGRGTTFTLRLPLTLAIIPALLVSVRHRKQDSILALPLNAVLETVRLRNGSRPTVRQREVLDLRGRVLPLLRLGQVLFEEDGDQGSGIRDQGPGEDFQSAVRHPPSDWVVIARAGGQEVGLVVDALLGQEEIVIKSLGGFLGNLRGLAGCTLLGDGRIALIVDLAHLVRPAERRMARWN